MIENVAHMARRHLVTTVCSYDPTVVSEKAVGDSKLFLAFLDEEVNNNSLEVIDMACIISDLENSLNIKISDNSLVVWNDLFNQLVVSLREK